MHHLRDQLPVETLEMFEINRVIKELAEIIDYNSMLEEAYKDQITSLNLDSLFKRNDYEGDQDIIQVDGKAMDKFLRQLSVTLEFWTKERTQVKQIWEEVKNINYYLEQDPINEKIKTANEIIIRLTNRC